MSVSVLATSLDLPPQGSNLPEEAAPEQESHSPLGRMGGFQFSTWTMC